MATDPQIAAQWPEGPDPRHTVQHAAAQALSGKPDVRPGVSVAMATDLLFGLLSPQLYLVFVQDRGWSPERWEEWPAPLDRPALRRRRAGQVRHAAIRPRNPPPLRYPAQRPAYRAADAA